MHRETNALAGVIAVEPFKTNSLEAKTVNGLLVVTKNTDLTPLQVVFGNEKYAADDVVYFEPDQCAQPWARRVLTIDGQKFILAPLGNVIVHEHRAAAHVSSVAMTRPLGGTPDKVLVG